MANKITIPIPQDPIGENFRWRDWLQRLSDTVYGSMATQDANKVDITGGSINKTLLTGISLDGDAITNSSISNSTFDTLTNITDRKHNDLQSIQGGTAGQYYHLTASQYASLSKSYGGFSYYTDQLFSANDTPMIVAFDTTEAADGITLASNQITLTKAGVYNVQYSIQVANTDSHAQNLFFWARKNTINIPGTASKFDVPASHGTSDGYLIAVSNFVITVNAGDYIEIVSATPAAKIISPAADGVYFEYFPASTSPYDRPTIPSNILTVTQVS